MVCAEFSWMEGTDDANGDGILGNDGWPEGYSSYAEIIASLRTGKAIVAVWADVDENGDIVPYASSVKCGNAGNSCFAVILPRELHGSSGHGTSFAAPRLGAAAFYLRQLWDRAEQVVGVLRQCAIDIGAPGVDDEFGAGAVNVDCPTVHNKEVSTAAASVSTEARSPALDSMTGLGTASGASPSFSFTAAAKPGPGRDDVRSGGVRQPELVRRRQAVPL